MNASIAESRMRVFVVAAAIVVMTNLTPVVAAPVTITVISTQEIRIGDIPPIPNGVVVAPRLLTYTAPTFPADALIHDVEGHVVLEVSFDRLGNFTVLRVIEGLGF